VGISPFGSSCPQVKKHHLKIPDLLNCRSLHPLPKNLTTREISGKWRPFPS